jgi:hypothetical protein
MRNFAMEKRVLVLTTSAFILACGAMTASAQQSPGSPMMQPPAQPQATQQPTNQEGPGMMGQGGMMGRGPAGMMGPGMMGGGMMRIIFSLVDSDGDATISLQEFQAAHERIFKGMDTNKDGRLTLEEMQAFMQGTRTSVQQQ